MNLVYVSLKYISLTEAWGTDIITMSPVFGANNLTLREIKAHFTSKTIKKTMEKMRFHGLFNFVH